jgi:hypothetical protein
MNDIVTVLNDPEKVYPGNFDTPQRANAFLFGLCQEAEEEIKKLRANEVAPRNDVLEEVAKEFDAMKAFGDTAASFAAFVRGMKR